MTYKITVDGFPIISIQGPVNITEIQRRIIIEGFSNDYGISPKGVKVHG